jgi:hypothetical protein
MRAASFYTNSRRALKEDIAPFVGDGLALIESLNVVQFRYKERQSDHLRVGFIADDTDPWFSGEQQDQFDLVNSVGITFDAVQRLAARNRELEARLAALEARLAG